ncbi:MAG: copper resistance protein B [Proteobacteria bacterium]|nr:copper resistance protein B [Desulfobulbaceae bacterium]MBU4152988.1 copper resistance protein B [Pseudomonadota bacterium]
MIIPKMLFVSILFVPAISLAGGMNDDPLLSMMMVNQLEVRTVSGQDPLVWDAEGWIGRDLDKLWIKTDGEYKDGRVEEAEAQALYSRAIAPFWDLQMGWRRDLRPTPDRDWLAVGVKGLAPYFFDVDAAIFVGDNGRTSARLQAEYEIMFTQRLILVPEIELNLYGKDDEAVGIGSGLSSLEAGLRLRYEIRREFAPYLGVNWTRLYGKTADYAREEGASVDDVQFVLGVSAWY